MGKVFSIHRSGGTLIKMRSAESRQPESHMLYNTNNPNRNYNTPSRVVKAKISVTGSNRMCASGTMR